MYPSFLKKQFIPFQLWTKQKRYRPGTISFFQSKDSHLDWLTDVNIRRQTHVKISWLINGMWYAGFDADLKLLKRKPCQTSTNEIFSCDSRIQIELIFFMWKKKRIAGTFRPSNHWATAIDSQTPRREDKTHIWRGYKYTIPHHCCLLSQVLKTN